MYILGSTDPQKMEQYENLLKSCISSICHSLPRYLQTERHINREEIGRLEIYHEKIETPGAESLQGSLRSKLERTSKSHGSWHL